MKIRSDFVTNSSSTAFVLIKRNALTKEGLRKLMGVEEDSPLSIIADTLSERLDEYGYPIDDRIQSYYEESDTDTFLRKNMSDVVADKVREARGKGHEVLMGFLSSEVDEIQSFLACDSFELENEDYYLNAIECYW